jgi:glycine hydroxymethyltransferase
MHVIAAKGVAFKEALDDSFITYQVQVVKNAKALANALSKLGCRIVSGGTDNHLLLVDVKSQYKITGLKAETVLHEVGITCNKNGLPFDDEKPRYTSGIRLGTPAVTTRGFKEEEMEMIALLIDKVLKNIDNEDILNQVRDEVIKITKKYPLY